MTIKKLHRLVHRHARHARSHARPAHRHVFVVTFMSWMELPFEQKPEPRMFLVKTNRFSALHFCVLIIAVSTFLQ